MKYVPDLTARLLVKSTCFRTRHRGVLIMLNIKCVCHTSLKLRVALLRVNCSALACQRIVTDAKGDWGALNYLARRGAPAVGKP